MGADFPLKPSNDLEQIRQEIDKRKIDRLIHFTHAENLPSILKRGLIPRGLLEAAQEEFCHNDECRMDGRTDCSCLSITYPNYPMFRKCYKYRWSEFVILGLDINLLFDQSLTPYFCAVNAASRVVKDVVRRCGWEYLSSIEAFNWMFDDGINKLLSDASSKYKKKDEALANETVDIQAEVLIKGVIAPSYICDIVVGNSKHENAVKCFLLSRQIKKYPNVIIANGYFFG